MAHLRRKWRILKWTGTLLCVLFMILLILPGYSLEWTQLDGCRKIAIRNGFIAYAWASGGIHYGRHYLRDGQRVRVSQSPGWRVMWWPPVYMKSTPPGQVWVATWLLLLFTVTPTAILWHRDRRIPPGHYHNCGTSSPATSAEPAPNAARRLSGRTKQDETAVAKAVEDRSGSEA